MKTKFALGILLVILVASTVWAETDRKLTPQEVKTFVDNCNFEYMSRDARGSLELLKLIQSGEIAKAIEFYEYQLDVVVCVTWDSMQKLSEAQKKEARVYLQQIKAYTLEHPRKVDVELDPKFKQEMFRDDQNYTERAKEILSKL